MSRSEDLDYEEQFPNQGELWWANVKRSIKGKNGRKVLTELREALLMLPEKRLISGAISTVALKVKYEGDLGELDPLGRSEAEAKCEAEGPGVCAVGAYLVRKRVTELGETVEQAMAAVPSAADIEECYLTETAHLGQEAGMKTFTLAWALAARNDEEYRDLTPEQRYVKFMEWIDSELGIVA